MLCRRVSVSLCVAVLAVGAEWSGGRNGMRNGERKRKNCPENADACALNLSKMTQLTEVQLNSIGLDLGEINRSNTKKVGYAGKPRGIRLSVARPAPRIHFAHALGIEVSNSCQ